MLSSNQMTPLDESLITLSMQDLSKLESLPRELVWMIIEYIPETVLDLRLASRSLKLSVDELAQTGQFMQELIIRRRDWLNPPELVIEVETLECYSKLFELRLKFGELFSELSKRISREEVDSEPSDYMKYTLPLTKNDDIPIILDYLRECMGRRIKTVRLLHVKDRNMKKAVPRLLEGIQFANYVVKLKSLSEEVGKLLLQRIMTAGVESLELSLDSSGITDPVQFLLDLSSHVSCLGIGSRSFRKTAPLQFDQVVIILEMFSRKLDRLKLRESVFFKPLNSESANTLRQRLPYLDKNICFWAACEPNKNNIRYRENDYIVQVDERWLRVIHKSRQFEGLDGYL
ncbi:hypothetical protein PRIPAC_78353 [Pristionchus pacificus]|uniref:Uncharacterized protein n=1 Tax=Pristionchus pacificus TaxID=54126 RepID=A0A2A6BXD7_PRIPA|nr:hypothetical protein PRIPAC_78353 [Pristionchus pacificus]|eukprot:PDM70565.1 hypothetical protein PRIPAC_46811 [Pristionchus pacificus]